MRAVPDRLWWDFSGSVVFFGFEVPAIVAAGSLQELQIQKRH
jgi:hypothetical protein